MMHNFLTIVTCLLISTNAICQSDTGLNMTDIQGRKQGHWIKKDSEGRIAYDGFFKDDHPVGEFKRYYENNTVSSLLIFNDDGTQATATLYHPNGYVSSKGKYINQKKEGKWYFYSEQINGYLLSEESYSNNQRNGPSLKFYPDGTIIERMSYIDDIKQGEWTQYYSTGKIWLKSYYLDNKINGKFEVWFEDGQIKFSGNYKNDLKDGLWYIYNSDGSVKYKLEYKEGVTNDLQMRIDEENYLDSLERNKGTIPDPEKTGIIR